MHKGNDDHIYEYVRVDIVITSGGINNNHDHAIEDEETFWEDFIYAKEDRWLHNGDNIVVSQSKYAKSIGRKFGFNHKNHKITSATTYLKLSKDERGVDVDQNLYKS